MRPGSGARCGRVKQYMADRTRFTRDDAAVEDFIRAETRILETPLVPEMRCHLATASKPLCRAAEERLPGHDASEPYWAFVWTPGLAIARYLLDNPHLVAGRRVMDFGCGAGPVAIAAKMAGAAEVVAVDWDPLACVATRLNAALNGVEIEIEHRNPVPQFPGDLESAGGFDVVLAGDVLYLDELADRYVPWFLFLSTAGCDVIFADRVHDPLPPVIAKPLADYSVFNPFEPNPSDIKSAFVFRIPPMTVELVNKTPGQPDPLPVAPDPPPAAPDEEVALTPEIAAHLVEHCTQVIDHPLVPGMRMHAAPNVIKLEKCLSDAFPGRREPGFYWAFPWVSGQALAKLILDQPERVRGKRVLDFACGSGQTAIAAALAGARSVRASDIDPIAAAATRLNAELNGVDIEVTETDLVGRIEDDWDLVLVGDIYYSEALGRRATGWLQALAARGTEVLIADNDRLHFPRDAFEALGTMAIEPYYAILDSEKGRVGLWRAKPA